ncbi:MAG TPA: copper homeostasis protein CutC [Gemmatimonadaceae bacterium]|nr:copper homeostasis protein CutC [Gemmatimonadaceae bacterium]
MSVLVEACVDSVVSAVAAERGGATRLELCASLADGGTTPSAGMLAAVKAAVRIPVFVIARPRGGAFVHSAEEIGVMRLDIEAARMLGADGVAAGVLTPNGRIDAEQLHALVAAAGNLPVTFHRAFDLVRDRDRALDTLIELGVKRVLTSGGAGTALEGVAGIATLVKRAAGRIEVMAGGGVREEHVQELVHRTGVREVHVRGTRTLSAGAAPNDRVRLRKPLPTDESTWEETDESRIREFVRLANG